MAIDFIDRREKRQRAKLACQTSMHRRSFLRVTGRFAASTAVLPAMLLAQSAGTPEHYSVATNERLMREHGILRRVLLMYDEVARRIETKEEFPVQTAIDTASIARKYIEDYHEKLEEEHIFPLFRAYYRRGDVLRLYAQKLIDLVDILQAQHRAGRQLTDRILAALGSLKTQADRQRLAHALRFFVRMYTPHMAREDTVLYPALHIICSPKEYELLGQTFNEIEHKAFGNDGFDIYLDAVTAFEKYLGIYDLSQYTHGS